MFAAIIGTLYLALVVFHVYATFALFKEPTDIKPEPKQVSPQYLLTDEAVTNTNYTWLESLNFMTHYPNSYLSMSDMRLIYKSSKANNLFIVFSAALMEFESNLVRNNAKDHRYAWRYNRSLAYGMVKKDIIDGVKTYRYGTFYKQLTYGLKRATYHYNKWQWSDHVLVKDLSTNVIPENAATYLLYKWRPFYSNHDYYNWGVEIGGNQSFVKLYNKMYKDWLNVKAKINESGEHYEDENILFNHT